MPAGHQLAVPADSWTLEGKTCLVTGASSGIGLALARRLVRRGARVVILCRTTARGDEARTLIGGGSAVKVLAADLSSASEIRRAAAEFERSRSRLDVLVNNAGVFRMDRAETADGHELTFAVNHLAPFLLTNLLAPTLRRSAPARVINISSSALAKALDWDDLTMTRRYHPYRAYAASKLANLMFTFEMARKLGRDGVTVNAVHPGLVRTGLSRGAAGMMLHFRRLTWFFRLSVAAGAAAPLHWAAKPSLASVTGRYVDRFTPKRPPAFAENLAAARRLWDVSAELVGRELSL